MVNHFSTEANVSSADSSIEHPTEITGSETSWAVDDPYHRKIFATVPLLSAEETQRAVNQAHEAQVAFAASTTLSDRIAMCEKLLAAFQKPENKQKIAEAITFSMGKPLQQALGEVDGMVGRATKLCEIAPAALEPESLEDLEDGRLRRKILREPVGLVLTIAPWNYPLLCVSSSLFPAILAGNAVLLKHSPRTPLIGDIFQNLAETEAGIPKGIVTALNVNHTILEKHVTHDPRIGYVSFTGSVRGGRAVEQSIGNHPSKFMPRTLELGGKDPCYVAPDADPVTAANIAVEGGFYNAGQSCCGLERIYVHENVYDAFVDAAKADVEANWKIGNPTNSETGIGPMALPDAPAFLQGQVDQAVSLGASVVTGGQMTTDSEGLGRFFAPTLVKDCDTATMSLMRDESFGPILGIEKVTSDEEAIAKMNDCRYGLTSVVVTKDEDRALRMSGQLESGTVFMNRCDFLDPELPWGGVKETGVGCSLSHHGFGGVTRLKGLNFRSA
eukprot:g1804.t1